MITKIKFLLGIFIFFGCLGIFSGVSKADAANVSSSSLSKYTLSAGDKIRISVYREPELTLETELANTGTIIYPLLGEIKVSGMTVGQLKDKITQSLNGVYLVDPKVSVQVLVYRQFFVSGEVKEPGSFPYVPGLTIRKAIAMAGGFTELAPQNSAKLVREKDRLKDPIDVNLEDSVSPGDTVIVMKLQDFYVNGEVTKPGAYTYVPDLTVQKAIAIAGGFTEFAEKDKAKLLRGKDSNSNSQKTIENAGAVNLTARVEPGDTLIVSKYANFYVNGEVKSPGAFAYVNALNVQKAISIAGGFTERASRSTVKIVRANDPTNQELEVDLNAQVAPGDVLIVEESFF